MSSSSKPANNFDGLPAEMICELFEHLHPKDLSACSMVNKRWHSIYSSFRLDRLVAIDEDPYYHTRTWWYEDQIIEGKEWCYLTMFRRLVDQPLVSKLRHFALRAYKVEFDLNRLNKFRQLVRLEITLTDLHGKSVILNLPRLHEHIR